jgi:alpha-beta hydrolase superfamily lysophospholipase
MIRRLVVAVALVGLVGAARSQPEVARQDFFVDGDPGGRLFVREVVTRTGTRSPTGEPILLLHGAARVPGLASFDLSVSGGSLAVELAQLGFDVYVMDVRGYGRSTRPKETDQPPGLNAPLGAL